MKPILLIALCSFVTSCALLTTQPIHQKTSRRITPEMDDLNSLEMLLVNEQDLIQSQHYSSDPNIRLGMNRSIVQRQMGQPSFVEVAGNPQLGNERWVYETKVPTLRGYYKERKIIYFERGNVVGWENQ